MAQTSTNKLGPTGIGVVDALTNGTYWLLGPDRTLTWALADQPAPDWKWSPAGASRMETAMAQVLAEYASVANIRFQFVGWFQDFRSAPADVVLSATGMPQVYGMSQSTYAWAYFPNEPMTDALIASRWGSQAAYPNASGDLILDFANSEMLNSSYLPGSNGFFAMIHEMGHALGLKHPHDNGGTPGRPTFQQIGIDPADTQRLTVMSYDPATSLAYWLQQFGVPANAGYPQTLMPLDVIALQSLYGPNTTTRAGDTVYQLFNDDAIATYWDAGGTDTLSAASSGFGWQVVAVASSGAENLVLATPFDSTALTGKFYFNVERFEGSQYSDRIVGTSAANTIAGLSGGDRLQGGGGNDVIDGGFGLDSAVYIGARAGYSVQRAGSGWSVVDRRGGEGSDSLISIERLQFADTSVAIDTAPGQNAIGAALVVRAILGPQALRDKVFVGGAIGVLDMGYSVPDLVAMAIGLPQFAQLAGSRSNTDFVRLVYTNVVGVQPGPADLAAFVGMLDRGEFTQASLGLLAATIDINALSPEIVGVVQGGIEYLPFS